MDYFLLNKQAETSKTNTGSFKLLRRCLENYNSMETLCEWTTAMRRLSSTRAKRGAVVSLTSGLGRPGGGGKSWVQLKCF